VPLRRTSYAVHAAETWREPAASGSSWFGYLPALGAVAALNAYGFLIAFPSITRPKVPLAAPCAALAFALLQAVFPRCRPTRWHLISPLNWVLLAFFVQLVMMPFVISWVGPSPGTLPSLPSLAAIDTSIALSVVAFASFSAGCSVSLRPRDPCGALPSAPASLPGWMLALYAGLGTVGLLLRFGSFGEVFTTLAEPAKFSSLSAEQQGTLGGAASTFLRPFLLSAIAMGWCAWMERRGRGIPRVARFGATAMAALAGSRCRRSSSSASHWPRSPCSPGSIVRAT